MSSEPSVLVRDVGRVRVVSLNRPRQRNAVDRATAESLADAFRAFDGDAGVDVAVLAGEGGTFCAGADLHAVAAGQGNRVEPDGDGPMGPTRLRLGKPVVAAIAGHAVAGGLELALWADLRVADSDAVLGVFCRRWGVPLIDGGTVRLPRLVGESRAMDLVLTGRAVGAVEAHAMGLVNRVVEPGTATQAAIELATQLSGLPQTCLRHDRLALLEQHGLPEAEAMALELAHGRTSLGDPEGAQAGAARFSGGAGRHGTAEQA